MAQLQLVQTQRHERALTCGMKLEPRVCIDMKESSDTYEDKYEAVTI